MIYGYARVSTTGQQRDGNSLTDQERVLHDNGAACVYKEAYTGTKMERPRLAELLDVLKEGDTLMVTKLDRLSRTAAEGGMLIKDLFNKGINVHILNMGRVDNTPMGKLMLTVLLGFAEFERDMIVERTMAGKEIARQREGYREGRKRLEINFGDYPERVAAGAITVGEACRQLGIGRQTWYNRMRQAS